MPLQLAIIVRSSNEGESYNNSTDNNSTEIASMYSVPGKLTITLNLEYAVADKR